MAKNKSNNRTTTDDRWISIIKEVRKQFAEKSGHYDQEGTVSITINGDTQICRTDCSGFVSACMYYYGAIKADQHPSSIHRYKKGTEALFSMEDTIFKFYEWPGDWNKIHIGDIMANSEHTQIFAGLKDGNPTAWSYGSDRTAGNPEPEVIYSHDYNFFTLYTEKTNTSSTSSTTQKADTTEKNDIKKFYRVGTDYKNGKVINQNGAFLSFENAKSDCINIANKTKNAYNVYDSNFNVVYSYRLNLYRVGTGYKNGSVIGQVGAFKILDNAIASCESHKNVKKTSYYVYDSFFKIIYSAEYLTGEKEFFRVGVKWKDGRCLGQVGAFKDGRNAINTADKWTKQENRTYYVFNPNGKVYYIGKR